MKEKFENVVNISISSLTFISAILNIYVYFFSETRHQSLAILTLCILLVLVISYYQFKFWKVKNKLRNEIEQNEIMDKQKLNELVKSISLMNNSMSEAYYELRSLEYRSEITSDLLSSKLKEICDLSVNALSDFLSKYVGEDVYVHIKHFPPTSDGKEFSKQSLKTLSRCAKTLQTSRHSIHAHKIEDNTHYQLVLNSSLGYEYIPDFVDLMKNYKGVEKFQLRNNSLWEEYYKSMILVAIRLDKIYDVKAIEKTHNYDTLGVIIADCKVTNAFKEADEYVISKLLTAFASSLYIYMDRNKYLTLQNTVEK